MSTRAAYKLGTTWLPSLNFAPMYYLLFGFLYLISLLPFFILYGISDFFFVILYYIAGYRRGVVYNNLQRSFPEKTEAELKSIMRRNYRNFTDNWIETIKLMSISKKQLNKRITGNLDALQQQYDKGKAVQANLAHFFNWELMTLYVGINQPYPFLTVYLPQSSKAFDRLMQYVRGRWGNPLLPSTEIARGIIPWRNKQYLLALGADQSPALPESGYWMYFMGQPAPFPRGPEKFARTQNIPVVMMSVTKPKRGHYNFNYFVMAEETASLPNGELLRRYVRHIEDNIRLQPDLYLWSHRRWKHPWKPEYAHLWMDDAPPPAATPKAD